jgi:hypothetical protein
VLHAGRTRKVREVARRQSTGASPGLSQARDTDISDAAITETAVYQES